jgi:hypothetical protein
VQNITLDMGAVGVGGVDLYGNSHPQQDPYEDAINVALHTQ